MADLRNLCSLSLIDVGFLSFLYRKTNFLFKDIISHRPTQTDTDFICLADSAEQMMSLLREYFAKHLAAPVKQAMRLTG
jgi:hypothetical protein